MGPMASTAPEPAPRGLPARIHSLVGEARDAIAQLPTVWRDRALLLAWLRGGRRAQWVTAGLLLFGLLIMPGVRDALVGWLLPGERSSGFLGFGRRVRAHPLAGTARLLLGVGYWSLATATAVVAWLLELPPQLAGAARGAGGRRPPVSATDATIAGARTSPVDPVIDDGAPARQQAGGRYVPERELGAGGMGVVHQARDSMLGRNVALKRLYGEFATHRELSARFLREARVLAQLSHPHIVPVFDAGEDEEGMWMAMELLPDGGLDVLLAQGGLPVSRVLELGVQLADAMAYAHAQGVVHRDFKPANVLMHGAHHAKVTDFGLARLAEQQGADHKLTRPGAVMGSPAYMSPEQASGGVADARSDIYSLGATLFEMLSGEPPFDGATASAVIIKHLTEVPALPEALRAELPPALVELVARMLEKDPADRPQTMAEVTGALRAIRV